MNVQGVHRKILVSRLAGIQATGISQKIFQIKLLISSFAALLVLISIILIWFFPPKDLRNPCPATLTTKLSLFSLFSVADLGTIMIYVNGIGVIHTCIYVHSSWLTPASFGSRHDLTLVVRSQTKRQQSAHST